MFKAFLTALIMIFLTCYPFIVYIGLTRFNSYLLTMILLTLLIIRLWLSKPLLAKMPWIKPASLLGILAIGLSKTMGSDFGIRLYPVIVNTVMFFVFAYSLYKGPSIIETFARITEPKLDKRAISYTKNVTKIWCVFFVFNASIALYTSVFTSLDVWAFYNGFIAYIIMGVLFAVEWLVRKKVKRNAGV
ncbi:hypothetical protein CWB60_06200 [Pseudoalteromonas sp. S327]|nr:hypothetical protein [Pseudoalteromonadaceae bacterium]OUX91949.1 MAG: hypothetical protein CBC03_02790 [Pseudoalteromonas sp. TMED43]TMO08021.1 hypothetical protein CWB60_06200 [Pseudoalteromonas sp. S327]TMO19689.1 hypothetical protein CWB59_04680 [Pseudoalteromonas sp. S326]